MWELQAPQTLTILSLSPTHEFWGHQAGHRWGHFPSGSRKGELNWKRLFEGIGWRVQRRVTGEKQSFRPGLVRSTATLLSLPRVHNRLKGPRLRVLRLFSAPLFAALSKAAP